MSIVHLFYIYFIEETILSYCYLQVSIQKKGNTSVFKVKVYIYFPKLHRQIFKL